MIDPAFLAVLLDALMKTAPAGADQSTKAREDRLLLARTLFEAWQPKDVIEAAQAALAVAAQLAALDSYARAARPGLSDETVIRLRNNATAAARVFDSRFRALRGGKPRDRRRPVETAPLRSSAPAAVARLGTEPKPFAMLPGAALPSPALTRGMRLGATALSSPQPSVIVP